MKNRSTFSLILTAVIIAIICITITLVIAFWVGFSEIQLFDFSDFNLTNFIPVILVGGLGTGVAVGIVLLFASKSIFTKIRDYFLEDKKDGGKKI